MPPALRFVQLAVVRSQLVLVTPFHASRLGVAVILISMELLPATSVAATPGGGLSWKFARLGVPLPYLIRVKVPVFRPVALMLIWMLVAGAEMLPLALMAGLAG